MVKKKQQRLRISRSALAQFVQINSSDNYVQLHGIYRTDFRKESTSRALTPICWIPVLNTATYQCAFITMHFTLRSNQLTPYIQIRHPVFCKSADCQSVWLSLAFDTRLRANQGLWSVGTPQIGTIKVEIVSAIPTDY